MFCYCAVESVCGLHEHAAGVLSGRGAGLSTIREDIISEVIRKGAVVCRVYHVPYCSLAWLVLASYFTLSMIQSPNWFFF